MAQNSNRNTGWLRSEIIKTVISILVLALGIGLFAYMYSLRDVPPDKVSNVLIPMVSVVPAKQYTDKIDLVVSGLVQPAHEINVMSEVNGIVKVKHPACESGSYVVANTPLLEIDPTAYNAALETSKADMEQTAKQIEEAQVEIANAIRNIELARRELTIAQADHQRNLRLLSQNVISKSEADQTERSYVAAQSVLTTRENAKAAAEARLESTKAAKALSQTRINQSELEIDKLTINASKTGVVVREFVQEGDAVRIGTPLLTFEATDKVEVLTTLTPDELEWIRDNQTIDTSGMNPEERIAAAYAVPKVDVKIFERNAPDLVWDGVLERFDGIGRDDRTKTIPCRIVIKEPVIQHQTATGSHPKALLRNTFVKCRIEVDIDQTDPGRIPLVIPATALTPGNYVWIANGKRLDRKKVTVLDDVVDEKTGQSLVVIQAAEDSIRLNDWVVTSPLSQPTIGSEARIVDEPEIGANSEPIKANTNSDTAASGMLEEPE